ncbi:hypothetical protein RFI_29331, partial [Reticulomyxa filosa]
NYCYRLEDSLSTNNILTSLNFLQTMEQTLNDLKVRTQEANENLQIREILLLAKSSLHLLQDELEKLLCEPVHTKDPRPQPSDWEKDRFCRSAVVRHLNGTGIDRIDFKQRFGGEALNFANKRISNVLVNAIIGEIYQLFILFCICIFYLFIYTQFQEQTQRLSNLYPSFKDFSNTFLEKKMDEMPRISESAIQLAVNEFRQIDQATTVFEVEKHLANCREMLVAAIQGSETTLGDDYLPMVLSVCAILSFLCCLSLLLCFFFFFESKLLTSFSKKKKKKKVLLRHHQSQSTTFAIATADNKNNKPTDSTRPTLYGLCAGNEIRSHSSPAPPANDSNGSAHTQKLFSAWHRAKEGLKSITIGTGGGTESTLKSIPGSHESSKSGDTSGTDFHSNGSRMTSSPPPFPATSPPYKGSPRLDFVEDAKNKDLDKVCHTYTNIPTYQLFLFKHPDLVDEKEQVGYEIIPYGPISRHEPPVRVYSIGTKKGNNAAQATTHIDTQTKNGHE